MYTTIMEMGQWVSSDNYTGRIVKLSNAFVFKGPIKNYSMDFPFIWDEINIPITYQSEVELAKKLILENASKILSEYTENSKLKWQEMVARYYIEDATLDPTLAIKLTDNWIEINLRYITDYKRRRNTKNMLFEAIEKAINQTSQKVSIASSTIQLMNYPPNDIRMKN
jgi:small-conductance mechanosensitive channel